LNTIKIKHCKGCILYGPPGTGKTLLARVIMRLFKNPATIINGPEVMDRFYGEAERKIR
jgi:SpoVK/Ycf46/Vps4 family AAA+-type ATPase